MEFGSGAGKAFLGGYGVRGWRAWWSKRGAESEPRCENRAALWQSVEAILSAGDEGLAEGKAELLDKFIGEDRELLENCLSHHKQLDDSSKKALQCWILQDDAAESGYAVGKLWEWLKQPDKAEQAYRACLSRSPTYAKANNQLGSLLIGKERWDEAIACFGRGLESDPNNAVLHNNLGVALWLAGEVADAFGCYRKAWQLDPNNPDFRSNVFKAALHLDETEVAQQVLSATLESQSSVPAGASASASSQGAIVVNTDPNWVSKAEADLAMNLGEFDRAKTLFVALNALDPASSHTGLGNLAILQGDSAAAELHFSEALRLAPEKAQAHRNLALAFGMQGRTEDALLEVERALSLTSSTPDLLYEKSLYLLKMGRWKEGWAVHEARLGKSIHQRMLLDFSDHPKWSGEALTGKVLALVAEQGAGDRIQFIRYASVLAQMGAEIEVYCEPSLKRLFSSVPGVARVSTGGEPGYFDYWIPTLSVPGIVGSEISSVPAQVPYVFPDADACRSWAERLSSTQGLRVGLAWAGNPELSGRCSFLDRRRSFPLAMLAPLWEVKGVNFFSLQKDHQRNQLEAFAAEHPIADFSEEWHDYADTAAFISALDLVISVDTSVVHLAGALNKPVWILSRFDGCWRWLEGRDDSPWYPSARLFRQAVPGDWEQVVARVAGALGQWK